VLLTTFVITAIIFGAAYRSASRTLGPVEARRNLLPAAAGLTVALIIVDFAYRSGQRWLTLVLLAGVMAWSTLSLVRTRRAAARSPVVFRLRRTSSQRHLLWIGVFMLVVTAWGFIADSRTGEPLSSTYYTTMLGLLSAWGALSLTLRGRVTVRGLLHNGQFTPWERVVALEQDALKQKALRAELRRGERSHPALWEFAEGDDEVVLAAWRQRREA
jgi:hypothetical protein